MKKPAIKLMLSKETLNHLEDQRLRNAHGGTDWACDNNSRVISWCVECYIDSNPCW